MIRFTTRLTPPRTDAVDVWICPRNS